MNYLLSFVSVGQNIWDIQELQFSLVLQYYAKWSLQYKLVVIVFPVHLENVPHFYVFVLGLVLGLFPGVAVELLWTLVVRFSLWRPLQCLERGHTFDRTAKRCYQRIVTN